VLLCLNAGFMPDVCIAPFQGTADLLGSQITGLTLSMTTTTKVVLALIAAGVAALVTRHPVEAATDRPRQPEQQPTPRPAVIDVGARARLEAKAMQVAASVYGGCHEQGLSVDVTYADGRVETDNTLFCIVVNSQLANGSRYDPKYDTRPGHTWRSVVSGDSFVRLVLQPSSDRIVRVYRPTLPSEWIGSIVIVPASASKLVGLIRLRADLPPDRNSKVIERATRQFMGHSGVYVRAMLDAEAEEYEAMLPPLVIHSESQ